MISIEENVRSEDDTMILSEVGFGNTLISTGLSNTGIDKGPS